MKFCFFFFSIFFEKKNVEKNQITLFKNMTISNKTHNKMVVCPFLISSESNVSFESNEYKLNNINTKIPKHNLACLLLNDNTKNINITPITSS